MKVKWVNGDGERLFDVLCKLRLCLAKLRSKTLFREETSGETGWLLLIPVPPRRSVARKKSEEGWDWGNGSPVSLGVAGSDKFSLFSRDLLRHAILSWSLRRVGLLRSMPLLFRG